MGIINYTLSIGNSRGRTMELIAVLFPVAIVICLLYIFRNMFKKKKMPSNNYTPFDDMMDGKKGRDN